MAKDYQTSGDTEAVKPAPLLCSYRLALALVGCFGFINLYALRVNMSVAMVCMVNHTALEDSSVNGSQSDDDNTCGNDNSTKTTTDGEFVWEKDLQGVILGSFFWGYLVTQIPGGWLAERFGGKRVYGYFMFVTAIATLLSPIGARTSPWLLMVLRIIKGLGEGTAFPAMHTLWAQWAPPLERSKLIGFTYAGAQIGNVITMPISGLLCDYGFDGGWASIFYVFGIIGVVWFILWMIIVSDSPSEHRYISDQERNYIVSTIGARSKSRRKELGTPWKSIFTSKPVWAIIVAHTFANWGTYTLLTNIPTFMKEVLKFDIKANGAFSALPYIAFWACINIAGWVSDALRTRGWSTLTVRRIMNSAGTILPGIFLVATGYVPCDMPVVAVVVLTIGVGCSGFHYAGVMVNHVDIAAPFAGTLFGISNTAATIPGIMAPYAIALITKDQTQGQWQIVFYIAAVIYITGNIFYCIFAAGETQDWAKPYMEVDEEIAIEVGPDESKDPLPPDTGINNPEPVSDKDHSTKL